MKVKRERISMYYILGARIAGKFETFMEAFAYQQEHHREKRIIYNDNGVLEIVWKPSWENININEL